MAQQQDAITITMADLTVTPPVPTSPSAPKKKQDTLFGPNIGIVARGPEWTESREKPIDELTPEIVRAWIAKSKQVSLSSCPSYLRTLSPFVRKCASPDCALLVPHSVSSLGIDPYPFDPLLGAKPVFVITPQHIIRAADHWSSSNASAPTLASSVAAVEHSNL